MLTPRREAGHSAAAGDATSYRLLSPSSSPPLLSPRLSLLRSRFYLSQRRIVVVAVVAALLFIGACFTAVRSSTAQQLRSDPRLIAGTNITATVVFPHDTTHIDWVDEHLPHLPIVVYSYNDAEAQHYSPGHCNEADAYLQYIVDNYYDLPDVNVFLHSHVSAWHVAEPGLIETLKTLRWERLVERQLTSFTCWAYYTELQRGVFSGVIYGQWEAFERLWGPMFNNELGEHPPDKMSAHQASSFAVTRQAIQRQPLSFYRQARKWCMDTNEDAQMTGRVYEYVWAKIFLDTWVWPRNDCCDLSDATCNFYSKQPG